MTECTCPTIPGLKGEPIKVPTGETLCGPCRGAPAFDYTFGTIVEDSDGDRWRYNQFGKFDSLFDEDLSLFPDMLERNYGPLKVVEEPKRSLWDEDPFKGAFPPAEGYVTKDSGERQTYSTGMQRDVSTNKPRFDLLVPNGIPFEHQFLTRLANLMMRGAEKYDARNWEKANTEEELARFKESAFRHFLQWFTGETDEDHMAAVCFNLMAYETTHYKMTQENK